MKETTTGRMSKYLSLGMAESEVKGLKKIPISQKEPRTMSDIEGKTRIKTIDTKTGSLEQIEKQLLKKEIAKKVTKNVEQTALLKAIEKKSPRSNIVLKEQKLIAEPKLKGKNIEKITLKEPSLKFFSSLGMKKVPKMAFAPGLKMMQTQTPKITTEQRQVLKQVTASGMPTPSLSRTAFPKPPRNPRTPTNQIVPILPPDLNFGFGFEQKKGRTGRGRTSISYVQDFTSKVLDLKPIKIKKWACAESNCGSHRF